MSAVALPSCSAPGYAYAELGSPGTAVRSELAAECALAISYNGLNHTVMMVSPADLEDFVRGFSLGAGLIDSIDDIYDIHIHGAGEALHADVQVSSRAFWALKQQRRQLSGASGCGLCGVEALQQALPQLAALPGQALPPAEHLA
uniref:formate dehydrogenase accessory sulfurtransferase FdhD n=1 Tax=Pseudomonas sp. BMS12 TaxID=1796033 RepID=UPI000AB90D3A